MPDYIDIVVTETPTYIDVAAQESVFIDIDLGGSSVTSVNGKTGVVALDAGDVGALATPSGTPDGTKYLRDDNSWQPVAGGSSALDISSIRFSGRYYTLPYSGNLSTALAGYVGAVYMFPVPIGEDHSIDALRFKVTSAVASSTIRIGLWGDNGSGLPGTLLLDSGTIPTDTTGDKTYTFTQISLSGKMFFYGLICTDNISLLGTNTPLPLLQRASGSDSAPSSVACNPPLASNPSLYPVTHYNTPIVEFRKV